MATQNDPLARYREHMRNPNVHRMLDAISAAEGTDSHGYRTAFGGSKIESLKDHPRTFHSFTQTDGKPNRTSAAGRYQFLSSTWDDVAGKLGLHDFGPESQDLAALELINRAGALDDVIAGNFDGAIGKLGATWASLPSSPYPQPKRTEGFMSNALNAVIPAAHASDNPFSRHDQSSEENPFMRFAGTDADNQNASSDNPFARFTTDQGQGSPQDQSRGFIGELGRQLGLTARAGLEGVSALPEMIVNPVAGMMGLPEMRISNTLDAVGFPQPENATERIAQDVAGAMAGAGSIAGGANALAQGLTGAGRAVAQQLGSAVPQQIAGAAGAGGAGGVARESGAGPVGQTAAALAGGLLASSATNRALTPPRQKGMSDPTRDLQRRASNLYDQVEQRGVTAPGQSTAQLQQNVRNIAIDEGLITPSGAIAEGYPKLNGAIRMIDEYAGQQMTAKQMQSVRRMLQNVAGSADNAERRIGTILLRTFDDFTAPLAPELAEARNLYAAAMRGRQLETLRDVAESRSKQFSQSGLENALRSEYRTLYNRILRGQERGFNPEQVEAIRRVAEGTVSANVARQIGKLAPTGVVSAGFSGGVPFMIGNAIGGPAVGGAASLGTMGVGALGRNAATSMTSRNAALAEALARNMPLTSSATPALTNHMGALYGAALANH